MTNKLRRTVLTWQVPQPYRPIVARAHESSRVGWRELRCPYWLLMFFPRLEDRSCINIEDLNGPSLISSDHDTAIATYLRAVSSVTKPIDTLDKFSRSNGEEVHSRSAGDSEKVRGLRERIEWSEWTGDVGYRIIRRRRDQLLRFEGPPVGLLRRKRRWTWRKLDRLEGDYWGSHCKMPLYDRSLLTPHLYVIQVKY